MALIQCKECKKEISDQAEICPNCGAKNKAKSSTSPATLFYIIVVGVAVGLAAINSKPSRKPSQPQPIIKQELQKWRYHQAKDDMTGKPVYTALLNSENKVNFKFPYNGPQRATLRARTHPRYGKDLMFLVQKGQILCNSYNGCTIGVKFDDGKVHKFTANEPSDHSSDIIFISNYSRFMGKLLKSKTVKISVEFYQEGSRTFTFNISEFSVDKYRPK